MNIKLLAAEACGELCNNNPTGLPKVDAGDGQITAILQIVFGIIGAIALIIIIMAGFKLVVSGGDKPEAAATARKTIIFAALGLIIAISAELVVSFVLNKL